MSTTSGRSRSCTRWPTGSSSTASLLDGLLEANPRLPPAFWPLGSNPNDYSGHARNGIVRGSVSYGAGKRGNAASFDGDGDYIEIADATTPTTKNHRFQSTDTYTLAAWVYPTHTGVNRWRGVVTKSRDGGNRYGIWITSRERWAADTPTGVLEGTLTVVRNAWTHVAIVQDGRTNTRRLYVNGALGAIGTAAPGDGTGPLWIGGGASTGFWFQGKIDDVRIYERALSPAEISGL